MRPRRLLSDAKKLAAALTVTAVSGSAFAEGVDSRTVSCTALQGMIAAQGFVFLSNPSFQDFVVANISSCPGGGGGSGVIQRRSVPTIDNPECLVNYCVNRGFGPGG